jgi:TolB-like protein
MKKGLIFTVLLVGVLVLGLIFTGCQTVPASNTGSRNASNSGTNSGTGNKPTATVSDELDTAIRDASNYLNNNIPAGSMIVILNVQSDSATLSDYIIDELIANAVNDKIFKVVDRQQLDLIRKEQDFQLSGEVDDNLALSIGKFVGAQTIVSGRVSLIGSRYRMTIRALEVQTALVQGQYNRNIAAGATITSLMGSSSSSGGGTQSTTTRTTGSGSSGQGGQQPQPDAQMNNPVVITPPIEGTIVPGNSLTEKLAWLQRSADSHNTYILEVRANENIAPSTLEYRGTINITIALRGDNANRTIRLRANGAMFDVCTGVTLILENNITLQGHSGNDGNPIVYVKGGVLKMNTGSAIIGNIGGNGVLVGSGTFEMTGGTISGNGKRTNRNGGGVSVGMGSGTFTMSGGTISGNTASNGGGVYVSGTFNMNGGIISGNTASNGGGVYADLGTFNMRGGTITNNTASENGGGVHKRGSLGGFNKNGGTITGYNSDSSNGNVVRDEAGNILARRGHAAFFNEYRRKETTAGPEVNLNSGTDGGWDN